MKQAILIIGVFVSISSSAFADITVPEGYDVVNIMPRVDGKILRLEAIRNPAYGYGVMAASIDESILRIFRINRHSYDVFATEPGFDSHAACPPSCVHVQHIRFDTTGLFNNRLYVSVASHSDYSEIYEVDPNGSIELKASIGDGLSDDYCIFAFTSGNNGYSPGMYLYDSVKKGSNNDGSSFFYMDPNFNWNKLEDDLVPTGRTDMDVAGMEFDTTGMYKSLLTFADADDNTDYKTAIYQLDPNLTTWSILTDVNSTNDRLYRGMCISTGGAFKKAMYVTELKSEKVLYVDPNGRYEDFASGFSDIHSITVSEDGNNMYVSDANGVWQIYDSNSPPGPIIVMREPWVESDDVHTGQSGVKNLSLLWNEPILFSGLDLTVTNEDGNSVNFVADGNNTEFMIVSFGETLQNDEYTITIADTVVSTDSGNAIDGDKDGFAGGDAILVMEHRERHDSDNDNNIDFYDLANFANKWLWME
jgi:hypothetical protein